MKTKSEPPGEGTDARERYLRTEFLDRIAHELRGPSGVTLGALDELELALGDAAFEHKALFAMARRGVRKVLRTAERLTRTAQLEAGHAQFTPMPTDLGELLRHAAGDAELLEARRGVAVELVLPEAPCLLDVDGPWVHAAVTEVITYALRAARRHVKVELHVHDAGVCIQVSDDGTAVSSPLSRRFEPRADRRDAGLSLPLAQDVARAHGGDLELDPQVHIPVRARITLGGKR